MTERLIVWHRMAPKSAREDAEPALIARWVRSVRARLLAAGGEILAQISGTVVGSFDPGDGHDVLEVGLDLLGEADEKGIAIALGIALGPVHEGVGRAVEIAELLATRAHTGELVLDPAARERAGKLFLFGRQVSSGVGGPRGAAIDRAHPRRDEAQGGIARLAPAPIAPITAQLVSDIVQLAAADPMPAIVLRGPVGAGATELVEEARTRARPRALITIGSSPGGVVPLASLRYGLLRAFGSDEPIASSCGTDDEGRAAARILRTMLRGALPPREALSAALGLFLSRVGAEGDGILAPWLFLTPLTMVDAASLETLLEARAQSTPLLLIARYPLDAKLPAGLAPAHEMILPPLRTSDARAIAERVLGDGTDAEVARKVAVLGGETPLGVVEVARALVASGDLVATEEGFVWRSTPRGGATSLPIEEIVEERLERLDEESRRMLEAICVAPEGAGREMSDAIGGRDGVGEKARARAIERLLREAWITVRRVGMASELLFPSSSFLRRFVVQAMPPSRSAELHRFVAEALLAAGADDATSPSLRAELGWYELEGGIEARGAPRLGEVGRLAIDRGYRRAAARIAALLARAGSADAESLSRAAATLPPPSSWDDEQPPSSSETALEALVPSTASSPIPREQGGAGDEHRSSSSFVAAAEAAVRRRDLEALEGLVQRAVAAGSDMAAIARFRALADLLKGDVGAAQRAIARARSFRDARGEGEPREAIAEAAVALGSGEPGAAVRLGLRALALARRAGDLKGERAALRTLAVCYRALGRDEDASRIEAAAAG